MSTKTTSTLLGLSLAVVVVALVALRVTGVFPPIDKKTELIGTIGGVQQAEKFRGEQFSFEDVKIDNPEVAEFVQSATFQNLMKDKNFRSLITNQEFVKTLPQLMEVNKAVLPFATDLQKFLTDAQNFQIFFIGGHWAMTDISLRPEVAKQIDYAAKNQQLSGAFTAPNLQEVMQLVYNKDFQKHFFANSEFQRMLPSSQDFRIIMNHDYQKLNVSGTDFNLKMVEQFSSSQEFQKLCSHPSMIEIVSNQANLKVFMSQDFQKMVLSQEFQNYFDSQDFQHSRSN